VVVVPFQAFADSFHGGIERHAQSPMHLVESTAPSGSSRLHSLMNFGAEINKRLQLLFATTFNTNITSQ